MVFLVFAATRVRRSRWAFWQRAAADVFAWMPLQTIDQGQGPRERRHVGARVEN